MQTYENLPTIEINVEDARWALANQLSPEFQGQVPRVTVYLPSIPSLTNGLRFDDLATPWDAPNLNGLRYADFRGTGYRLLKKKEGRITWSEKVDDSVFPEVVDAFYEKIVRALEWIFTNKNFSGRNEEIVYTETLVVGLLRGSFLLETKPRLVPEIRFPSDAEIVALMREVVPGWTLSHQDYSGSKKFSMVDGQFRFEFRGERGELENFAMSPNETEVLTKAFALLMNRETFESRSYGVFDDIFLRQMLPK
ncbi:MAG: hypothetical protein V4760_02225 [Bdellovibrionota bacterium]